MKKIIYILIISFFAGSFLYANPDENIELNFHLNTVTNLESDASQEIIINDVENEDETPFLFSESMVNNISVKKINYYKSFFLHNQKQIFQPPKF